MPSLTLGYHLTLGRAYIKVASRSGRVEDERWPEQLGDVVNGNVLLEAQHAVGCVDVMHL